MDQSTQDGIQPEKEDIIFECPQCGKSLEIDARGAGYLIVCPDCENEIQVPSWEQMEDSEPVPAESATRVESPLPDDSDLTIEDLQAKIQLLERRRKADNVCFKRLGDEITLIQASLDRITEIVESRQSNG